ncbi:MAG: YigZ family protein [Clostridiales bacterium]|nr:YigZ family protein [Clostridiales bacterium]MCF8022130.1 YigZ family protein [Clostridiales bacterium]
MEDKLITIEKPAQTEIIIKKSRFITSIFPAHNKEEAVNTVNRVKMEHNQANHNVYAYVINEQVQRCSDDGEPGGTAGKPVLDVIKHKGLNGAVLLVTRYFGGIKLGAGGLVRAYKDAAVKGIEAAGISEKLLYQELNIIMDYQQLGAIKNEIENSGGREIIVAYEQQVHMQAFFPLEKVDIITKRLIDMTANRVKTEKGKYIYL